MPSLSPSGAPDPATELTEVSARNNTTTRSVRRHRRRSHSTPTSLPPRERPLTYRQRRRRRHEDAMLQRREDFRQRRQMPTVPPYRPPNSSAVTLDCLYQGFCQCVTLLLLPFLLVLALLGVLLFAVFFCMPLLCFLVALVCMYYCCTEEPIPPRVLFRALLWENNHPPEAAAMTPAGMSPEQLQELIIKRTCIEVITEAVTPPQEEWGVNLLLEDNVIAETPVYWPVHDEEESPYYYYVFTKPMTHEEILKAEAFIEKVNEATRIKLLERAQSDTGVDGVTNAQVSSLEEAEEETKEEEGDVHQNAAWPQRTVCHHTADTCSSTTAAEGETQDAPEPDIGQQSPSETSDRTKGDGYTTTNNPYATGNNEHEHDPSDNHNADRCAVSHGAVCDICLAEYEAGDVVAWSPNLLCKHAFHVECITDWLIRRPTCPSCRQEYITIPETMKNNSVGLDNRVFHRHRANQAETTQQAAAVAANAEDSNPVQLVVEVDDGSQDRSNSSDASVPSSSSGGEGIALGTPSWVVDETELSSVELGSDENV